MSRYYGTVSGFLLDRSQIVEHVSLIFDWEANNFEKEKNYKKKDVEHQWKEKDFHFEWKN